MTLDDFRNLVDAYGADPARWPGDRRTAAETLLAGSPNARATLAEARVLDRLLRAAAADDEADTARMERVVRMSVLKLPPHPGTARSGTAGAARTPHGRAAPWLRAVGLTCAALAGIVFGSIDQPASTASLDITQIVFGPTIIESLLR